jgi:hypothetical protein
LDHAESTVDGPKEEEKDEHVVGVPETFIVGPARFLDRSHDHAHQSKQHHVAGPAWTGDKVSQQPSVDAEIVLGRNLGEVVPVSDGVHPRPEDNGPGNSLVESDVLVKLNDTVQWRLSSKRNECSADREQDQRHVNM